MLFRQITDPDLAQNAYLIGCQRTGEALIVDPERDVDRYLNLAESEGLRITAVAETHIHADYLSGARELAEHGARLYLSAEGGPDWQYFWAEGYDHRLLRDGDTFEIGKIEIRALHTPGHTPEHLAFLVTDRGGGAAEPMGLISGDFVFVGDLGRPDLLESAAGQAGAMEPSARTLYRSARAFLELPDFLQLWPAHGAGSACGKALGAVPSSTVGYEKRFNGSLAAVARGEEAFVEAILAGQPEPPLYFGRMKRLNKEGPPRLGALPTPQRLTSSELRAVIQQAGPETAGFEQASTVVLDTRLDRTSFMAGHLPGSLYAPLNRTFPTIAGSYVEPEQEIVLLVPEAQLETAVRGLVRIGLDRVAGWAPPETLLNLGAEGGLLRSTETLDFPALAPRLESGEVRVLDVRRAAEFAAGHVPGALNIAHTRLAERAGEVESGKPVAVHCLSGARAACASALLERLGHEVLYIDDAFANWRTREPGEAGTAA